MKNWHYLIIFTFVAGLVMVSGCATTSFGNQQAGNFGVTPTITVSGVPTVVTSVQTTPGSVKQTNAAARVAVPVAIQTTMATTCMPVTNTNVVVYLVSSTGDVTQIATATTDAGGKFTFTFSPTSKSSGTSVSFGFDHPIVTVGSTNYTAKILEDGLSTVETHTAKISDGPTYTYTLCRGEPMVGLSYVTYHLTFAREKLRGSQKDEKI